MVSNDVVLQTVKRMLASGIDDETIKMTLKGISLSDEEGLQVLAEAKGMSPDEEKAAAQAADDAINEGKEGGEDGEGGDDAEEGDDSDLGDDASADGLHSHIESSAQEQLSHHSQTHQLLQEHADKIDAVHEDVESLHGKIDSSQRLPSEAIASISALDRRISSLEKAVGETGASALALKSLMQKIVDSQRQILLELQKKK